MIARVAIASALAATTAGAQAIDWRAQGKDIVAAGLPADARLEMRLIGPGRGVARLDEWLLNYADRDAPTLGRITASTPPAPIGPGRLVVRAIEGRTAAGYIGRLLPGGMVIGCRVIAGGANLAALAKTGMVRCLQSLNEIAAGVGGAPARGATPVRTTVATPLREADIAEVLFVFEMPTLDPFSGTLKGDQDTYLLLRDGRFYYNFNLAPAQFDIAALRRDNPRRWGRWVRSAGTVQLKWDDGRSSTVATDGGTYVKPCRPARPGETFAQSFRMLSGSSIGGPGNRTTVATSRNFVFRSDGSFGSRGGTYGTTPNTTTGVSSGDGGRYRLNGYTLTLAHADGQVEQRMYCRVESGSVVINGVQYFKDS